MMKKKATLRNIVSGLSVLMVMSFMFISGATAGKITDFSAEQVTSGSDGKAKMSMKIFAAKEKMRMEMPAPWGKGSLVNIVLQDKKTMITVFPEKKVYFERPLSEEEMQNFMASMKTEREEKDLGTEKVNGFTCKKKEIKTTVNVMGRQVKSNVITWVADEYDMPMKTQDDKGNITELRNLKPGKQPPELFEVPKDFKKVSNMMEAMKP